MAETSVKDSTTTLQKAVDFHLCSDLYAKRRKYRNENSFTVHEMSFAVRGSLARNCARSHATQQEKRVRIRICRQSGVNVERAVTLMGISTTVHCNVLICWKQLICQHKTTNTTGNPDVTAVSSPSGCRLFSTFNFATCTRAYSVMHSASDPLFKSDCSTILRERFNHPRSIVLHADSESAQLEGRDSCMVWHGLFHAHGQSNNILRLSVDAKTLFC